MSFEKNWYIVPYYIRKLPGLTFAYLDVFETIFEFWNNGRECMLNNKTIMARTGIEALSTVKEALAFFEKNNILKKVQRGQQRFLVQITQVTYQEEKKLSTESGPFGQLGQTVGQAVQTKKKLSTGSVQSVQKPVKTVQKYTKAIKNVQKYTQKSVQTGFAPAERSTPPPADRAAPPRPTERPYNNNNINTNKKLLSFCPSDDGRGRNFEEFWTAYPRKEKRKRAEEIWSKMTLDKNIDLIINHLKDRLKNDQQWQDKKFIPMPDKFLKDERWNDEIICAKVNQVPVKVHFSKPNETKCALKFFDDPAHPNNERNQLNGTGREVLGGRPWGDSMPKPQEYLSPRSPVDYLSNRY